LAELQAIELDAWAEGSLLQINQDVDQEPIYLLLKMSLFEIGIPKSIKLILN
jgi:hypothetical protein